MHLPYHWDVCDKTNLQTKKLILDLHCFKKPNLILHLPIDQPVEPGKTPTEAHSGLKSLIDALVEEVREDVSFQVRKKTKLAP